MVNIVWMTALRPCSMSQRISITYINNGQVDRCMTFYQKKNASIIPLLVSSPLNVVENAKNKILSDCMYGDDFTGKRLMLRQLTFSSPFYLRSVPLLYNE